MTTENALKFVVKTNGRPPQEIHKLAEIVYESLSVRKPLDRSPSMFQPGDEVAPARVDIVMSVLAEDDDEVDAAAQAIVNAFRNFQIETVGAPQLSSSRPVLPKAVETAGVSYDEASQALTIDTWAPTWKDLELTVFPAEAGRVVAIIADHESGGRREQAVDVKTITVRRHDGLPPTARPTGQGASE